MSPSNQPSPSLCRGRLASNQRIWFLGQKKAQFSCFLIRALGTPPNPCVFLRLLVLRSLSVPLKGGAPAVKSLPSSLPTRSLQNPQTAVLLFCRNRCLADLKLVGRAGFGCKNCFQLIWGRAAWAEGPTHTELYVIVCVVNTLVLGTVRTLEPTAWV